MTNKQMPEALQDMKRRAIGEKDSNGVMGPTWATPKEVLSLIAEIERLREEVEELRKDGERLIYATKDYDGFVHVKKDKWDYALECAIENNRDPKCEDELNGVRRLIDAAMQSTKVQP